MIIDSHIHLGIMPGHYSYDTTLDSLLRVMDKTCISYAISSHFKSLCYGDLAGGMEDSINAYNASDGRIMSYYMYNPCSIEESLHAIKSCSNRQIFKGIKIHPSFHNVPADDERYDHVWKYALNNNLLILSHTWDLSPANPVQKYSYPALFEKYIRKYPEVRLMLCHSGGRYDGIRAAAELGKKYENLYFDTAGDIYINGFVEYMAGEVGSERLLFGSDYSMMDQRTMLGVILGADITVKDKENILYENASNLFGIKDMGGVHR